MLQWVPILFTSALTGQRVQKVLDLVLEVAGAAHAPRIDTHEVNEVRRASWRPRTAAAAFTRHAGQAHATRPRSEHAPPTFVLFSNHPKAMTDALHSLPASTASASAGASWARRSGSGSAARRDEEAHREPAAPAARLPTCSARFPTSFWVGARSTGSICDSTAAATWARPTRSACSAGRPRCPYSSWTSPRAGSRVASSRAGMRVAPWGWALAYGAAAILGHVFSVYVRFKGGKGVATSAGVFLALAPVGGWRRASLVWAGSSFASPAIVSLASIVSRALIVPDRGLRCCSGTGRCSLVHARRSPRS